MQAKVLALKIGGTLDVWIQIKSRYQIVVALVMEIHFGIYR